jgi:transposase-like protein
MENNKLENECVPHRVYSEQFKRQVIEEYLRTRGSKKDLMVKYNIKFKGAIQTWMRQLGYINSRDKSSTLDLNPKINMDEELIRDGAEDNKEALVKRVKELERLLEDECLKSEAYNRMIELAEKELKISIRKKANTR